MSDGTTDQTPFEDTVLGTAGHLAALPFWNPEQRRFRAFFRVIVAVVIAIGGAAAIGALLTPLFSMPVVFATQQILRALLAVALLGAWARYVDRRPFAAYGFHLDRDWWIDLLGGILIGTAIHFGAFATFLIMGWAHVTDVGALGAADGSFTIAMLTIAVAYVCVAMWEESVFRGLFIINGAEGLGWVPPQVAVVIAAFFAAVVFGVLHFQQASSPLSLLFWIGMGVVLALTYAITGELALPVGLHFAYNFAGNSVFGITGVATDRLPTLFRLSFTGPKIFVRVAGVVNAAFIGVGFVLLLAWIQWRYGNLNLHTELAAWRAE
jgi:membrane protease YdiL (CAAX protease family)